MTLEKAIEFGKIFLKSIENEKGSATYEFVETAVKMMEQEPKVGHWNTYVVSNRGIDEEWLECSECMWSNALVMPRNHCPNCGARMIEGSE
jgi:hypothetical protein